MHAFRELRTSPSNANNPEEFIFVKIHLIKNPLGVVVESYEQYIYIFTLFLINESHYKQSMLKAALKYLVF